MTEPSRAVFLSYASEDADAARRISEKLRTAGIEVWFDQRELRGGDAWDRQIRKQIHCCALFIPLISSNTQSRLEGYFRREWKLAVDRTVDMAEEKAFIVPVAIDDTSERYASVPDRFHEVQWTRLMGGETPATFVQQISRLLSPEQPQSPIQTHALVGAASGSASASIAGTQSKHPSARSKLVVLLIALAIVLIGSYVVLDKFILPKRAAVPVSAPVVQSAVPVPNAIPEKSIGVLPFLDMSEKEDQEYFADGLAEELLDLLAQVPDLKVPARSSSFHFRGNAALIGKIGRELGVTYLLEGGVRKAGDTMRVSVQLIRADSGYQVWSQTYERNVSDIFKVQDEISAAVVDAFKLRLNSPGAQLTERRTANPEAYDQYLRAKHFFQLGDYDGLLLARDAYHRSIELDPNFGLAFAGLAMVEYLAVVDFSDRDQPDAIRQALDHADHAVALAPALAETYSARALIRISQYEWALAQADLEKALALDPRDVWANRRLVLLQLSLGQMDAALAAQRRVVDLNPLDAISIEILGMSFYFASQGPDARRTFERVRVLSPGFDGLSGNIGFSYLADGQAAAARRECEAHPDDTARACLAAAEHALGNEERSRAILADLIQKHARRACYFIAKAYGFSGNSALAIEWLDRAFRERAKLLTDVKSEPAFGALHGDPRFKALLRKMNLPE